MDGTLSMTDKKALIEKLQHISELANNLDNANNKMWSYEADDHYERKVSVPPFPELQDSTHYLSISETSIDNKSDDAVEQITELCRNNRKKLPDPPKKQGAPRYKKFDCTSYENKKSKFNKTSIIVIIVAAFLLLNDILNFSLWSTVPAFQIICLLMSAVLVGVFFYCRNSIKATEKSMEKEKAADRERFDAYYKTEVQRIENEYNEKMKAYEEECARITRDCYRDTLAYVNKYKEWRTYYLESLREENDIGQKLEAEYVAGRDKIKNEEVLPAEKALKEANDIVPDAYLGDIDDIIGLLKNGRADSLKEAINLHEEIQYRERQLELEREIEYNRQREAEQQRAEEERRNKEEVEYRKEQDRMRAREDERRRWEEDRRQREENLNHRVELEERKRQERLREDADRRAKLREESRIRKEQTQREIDDMNRTRRQCNSCSLSGACSMKYHRVNCASYRPR